MPVANQAVLDELKSIDPTLEVRWERCVPDDEGNVVLDPPVTPDGGSIRTRLDDPRIPGSRWVVYAYDRHGRPYKLFDVLDKDGSFMPLDMRVVKYVDRRSDVWDELEDVDACEEALRRRRQAQAAPANSDEVEAQGDLADALETHYRVEKGLKQYALGSPDAPAVPNTGFYVRDRRRFVDHDQHHLEV